MDNVRKLSLWWDTLPDRLLNADRPALQSDLDVDVAIIGAGYTGLWTAYYLAQQDPSLSIAILEAQVAGFGASGRNGGWCSSYFPTEIDKLGRMFGRTPARAMQSAMHDTVDEVGRVIREENIDCYWAQGGSITYARTGLQWKRAQEYIQHWEKWGFGPDHYRLLSAAEAHEIGNAPDALGATWNAHVAAIHPARLVRSLAQVVELKRVKIFENSPVRRIGNGYLQTDRAFVSAKYIVRATEGYTPRLEGMKRDIAPIYSLMIATEPLSDEQWKEIGLESRATFSDWRNLIIYGQRTADNRFAFGGRGAPYHFGSAIKNSYDRNEKVHDSLIEVLTDLFPAARGARVSHEWGGPLGIARDWMASVGLNRATGFAWAGGYVGDGVGTSNLSGRTLADLILGKRTLLTELPWVNHRSRKWEPEPLRWLGANAGLKVMTYADHAEDRSGKPSRVGAFVSKFLGQ